MLYNRIQSSHKTIKIFCSTGAQISTSTIEEPRIETNDEIDEETVKKTVRSSLENVNKGTQSSTTNDKQIEELKTKEKSQSTSNISISSFVSHCT